MELAIWIILGIILLCWLVSWLLFWRLEDVPAVADAGEVTGPNRAPAISVIIPARNEEKNLVRLLDSLNDGCDQVREVIVVDDQSTDATGKVARDRGARVISPGELPAGWKGKPRGCQKGAEAADGEWLLFLDADTWLQAGGMKRLAALTRSDSFVYSVCPYHRLERCYEQLSAFFHSMMVIGSAAFPVRRSEESGCSLFGQLLLVHREHYEEVGGHEVVKAEVLENFQLSRVFEKHGIPRRCFLGRGTVNMQMYPDGLRSLIAGWGKGIVSGAGGTPGLLLAGVAVWQSGLISMMITVIVMLVALVSGGLELSLLGPAAAVLYALWVGQLARLFSRLGQFSLLTALVFPVGVTFYQWVFFRALVRKRQQVVSQWKGRDVA